MSDPKPAKQDAPLKLGYLVPQFPGQTHIFFWRELADLARLGVETTLFSTRPPPPGLISHDWSKEAMAHTIYLGEAAPRRVLGGLLHAPWGDILGEGGGKAFLRDALVCLPAAYRLVAECRARGIDHVHSHSCGRAALICALARRMGGPSYSLTLHGPMSDYGPGQGIKWRHASFATIITRKLLAEAEAELGPDLPRDVTVQPMGVDTEDFKRTTPYQPPAPGAPLRLFACGRLNMVKGHQDLLSALRLLLDRGVDAELDIAGEDDVGGAGYHQDLQAHLDGLGLDRNARLLGAISAAEVRRHLLAADVFVLASWHEPLGVAYMEAMACGVPTIGTDAGGVRELITHGQDGMLVPPKDPERLADSIAALAGDPALCAALSEAGRRRVVDHFRSSLGAETLIKGVRRALTSDR
ncbi:exopolysaccharide biosynthesis GT4 family glycosyltransferase EpsE [uncultured Roseovarius sp.]|uniref:exopolysaccharide biosynthesis GT4 family glycosyltransferase EpsE n=1 Tax=uncultured Roseovarius sp. TaxID=293344 RepID=UPI0025FF7E6E|nr:exopolysaccharide biosynthesis GT4 family glycosyltransferase EpsE [uncultured Roseovarius sp.]